MAKTEKEVILLPVGRVINCSLFEKDTFVDAAGNAGKPSYKIELAFDPFDVEGPNTVEDKLIEAAVETWGDGADDDYFESRMRSPLLDGDKLAERREAKGKPGDAYKGKLVIRAHTLFNKDGYDGPGGIQVWNDNDPVGPILAAQREQVYAGCFGIAAVTIGTYTTKNPVTDEEVPALMFYLSAFQKTDDGDRLMTPKDTSTLFKPTGRKKSKDGETTARRTRKG